MSQKVESEKSLDRFLLKGNFIKNIFKIKMKSLIKFSILLVIAAVCSAEYEGPYLLWGLKGLDDIKVPTLQGKNLKFSAFSSISQISYLTYNSN